MMTSRMSFLVLAVVIFSQVTAKNPPKECVTIRVGSHGTCLGERPPEGWFEEEGCCMDWAKDECTSIQRVFVHKNWKRMNGKKENPNGQNDVYEPCSGVVYFLGYSNSLCGNGSGETIPTLSECQIAVAKLNGLHHYSLISPKEIETGSSPTGCYRYGGYRSNTVYFNKGVSGVARDITTPICKIENYGADEDYCKDFNQVDDCCSKTIQRKCPQLCD